MIRVLLVTVAGLASLAAQTPWPDLETARALFAEQQMSEAYDALRARLGRTAELYGASGATRTAIAMLGDPLAAPGTAIAITDRLDHAVRAKALDLHALFVECARCSDVEPPSDDFGPAMTETLLARAEGFDARLDLAVELLTDARRELDVAFAAIPVEERAALHDATQALLSTFVGNVYPTMDPAHGATVRRLLQIDRAALLRAACSASIVAQPGFWMPLRDEARRRAAASTAKLDGIEGKLIEVRDTPCGPLVLGGFAKNRYARPVALAVDFGGDDTWSAAASAAERGHELTIAVDLYGNDSYEAPAPGAASHGAACLGIAILVDQFGDDRYAGERLTQGAGAAGIGVLCDLAGKDSYVADAYAQGAGFFGYGVLVDGAGNDTLEAALYAQGFGAPAAVGLCIDVAGEDRRTATGRYPSSYGTAGEFMAMSQGCGIGMRTLDTGKVHVGGGFGILLDGGGDDHDTVGEFGYGIGYFLGVGIVRERGGNDLVEASRYGIATGAHQAVGLVLDDDGDDRYVNRHVASIAGNWDHMVSVLIDARGDDVYEAGGISLGSATITSFGALIDGAGKDRYAAGGGELALGNCGHPEDVRNGLRSIALFLDLAGQDEYLETHASTAATNGALTPRRRSDTHETKTAESGLGLFVDRGTPARR
ncbi:MAG: hypothetical protein IT457_18205 [Planctomycetes bacterium]|nr:hypothetical protein [Planctomycetota bacterium]